MVKLEKICWFALIAIFNVDVVFSMCNSNDQLTPIWNHQEFPCNQYFKACRFHHEGREGVLQLPVKQDMKPPSLDIFEYGDVNITFSHAVDVFHVPEGDDGQQKKVSKNPAFTIFIKDVYRDRMEGLKTGDILSLDVTFRSQMLKPSYNRENLGISSIKFGRFQCPSPPPAAEPTPRCRILMVDSQPDGYRAIAVIPIEKNTEKWEAEFEFSVDVRDFQSPAGHTKKRESNDLPAKVTNLKHNGHKKMGHEFHLPFNIHFQREDKENAKKISIRFNDWHCKGGIIRNKIWN